MQLDYREGVGEGVLLVTSAFYTYTVCFVLEIQENITKPQCRHGMDAPFKYISVHMTVHLTTLKMTVWNSYISLHMTFHPTTLWMKVWKLVHIFLYT